MEPHILNDLNDFYFNIEPFDINRYLNNITAVPLLFPFKKSYQDDNKQLIIKINL